MTQIDFTTSDKVSVKKDFTGILAMNLPNGLNAGKRFSSKTNQVSVQISGDSSDRSAPWHLNQDLNNE